MSDEPLAVQAARALLLNRVHAAGPLLTNCELNFQNRSFRDPITMEQSLAAAHAVVEAERHLRFALVDAAKVAPRVTPSTPTQGSNK